MAFVGRCVEAGNPTFRVMTLKCRLFSVIFAKWIPSRKESKWTLSRRGSDKWIWVHEYVAEK